MLGLKRKTKTKYLLSDYSFPDMSIYQMDKKLIEKLKKALQGQSNKFVKDKQIPLRKTWEEDFAPHHEYKEGKGTFTYLDPYTITGWEHERIHVVKNISEGKKWYHNIAPVAVNLLGSGDYNFSNGNHRVNMCNLLNIPIPVYII